MDFDQYDRLARRSANLNQSVERRLDNWALGLGEVGEVMNLVKKVNYHGHEMTADMRAKILDEMGDVLWYLSNLAQDLGRTLNDVAYGNITKLKARYPEGFSEERSINRD